MIEKSNLQNNCKLVRELIWKIAELGYEEMPAEQFISKLFEVNKKAEKMRVLINSHVPDEIDLVTRQTMREVRKRYGIDRCAG